MNAKLLIHLLTAYAPQRVINALSEIQRIEREIQSQKACVHMITRDLAERASDAIDSARKQPELEPAATNEEIEAWNGKAKR